MYFIRNLEVPTGDKKEVEYEVTTDSAAFRSYATGDYLFSTWERPERKPGIYRKLLLRILAKTVVSAAEVGAAEPTRKGFYHGGGIAEELIALAALFLRARFKLGPVLRIHDAPIYISREEKILDRDIIRDSVPLDELGDWFKLAQGLKDEWHLDFITAARFYQRGLLFIDTNPEIAYLDLISAIETLSGSNGFGKRRKRGLVKARFVKFIINNTTDDFWDPKRIDTHLPPVLYVEKNDLKEYLKRVYRIRSDYLHDGIPFPPFIYEPPYKNAELPLGDKTWTTEKLWTKADFIPLPHFFERLVRHVLINFLRDNQKEAD